MSRVSSSSRLAWWAAVLALLLKSAVPLLVAVAAHAQGVPVAELCAVYGVALPGVHDEHASHHAHHHAGPDHPGSGHAHSSAPLHGSDHCALQALGAWAGTLSGTLWAPSRPPAASIGPGARAGEGDRPDACAVWAALLTHGPPAQA